MSDEINKSSRHSKITGNFGENLVCYWLSRRGFETAHVDHTGIDVISKRPKSTERLGISVKMRSKIQDSKLYPLNISREHIEKAEAACEAFGCVPYFAIIADQNGKITCLLISLTEIKQLYPKGKKIVAFNLSDTQIEKYKKTKGIDYFEFKKTDGTW